MSECGESRYAKHRALNQEEPGTSTRIQQVERLLLSGELLLSLSHEVRNGLQGVMGNLQLLEHESLNPEAHELVEQILASGHRLQHLLQSILGLAHADDTNTACDVADVLTTTITLIQPLAVDSKVRVDLIDPVHVEAAISPYRLQQVLLNLLINSVQAMSLRGGSVQLITSCDDTSVAIIVKDNGPGIPEPIRSRIFEPFFSTKSPDIGTGLGLAIARNLLHGTGGELKLTHAQPGNTTFEIRLRRALETTPS